MKRYLSKKFRITLTMFLSMIIVSVMAPLEVNSAPSTFTIWPSTATPASTAVQDIASIELGVKFRADSSGYITGIRFYKASTNTGTHVGSLWASDGILLAQATFTNETASGWQQVTFSTPVAITANTVYVASYHTNVGQYSYDPNYFTGQGMDSPPLHALADGESGFNGVYVYASTSTFPSQGSNSSNFWVDVLFSTTLEPEPAAFTIWPSTATPVVTADLDFAAVELGVKFRAESSGYITGIRFYKASTNTGTHMGSLWTSDGALLAQATFINETASGWQQVTLSTPVAITADTVYVASYHTNVGQYSYDPNYFAGQGVDSPPLHALADGESGFNGVYAYTSTSAFPSQGSNSSNYWVDVLFSTTLEPEPAAFTIWPSTATPVATADLDTAAAELGVKFRAESSGYITGIQFYKASTNTGTHVGSLWTSDGALLAQATFINETASGWQQVTFSTPAAISAGTVYVASYHTNVGQYSYDPNYFTGQGVDSPPLYALADGESGFNGVYAYALTSTFPTQEWNASNYWVDVLFSTTLEPEPSPDPEPDGWYAGDMHVHRSCGGPPESISSMHQKMTPQNLSVISLLADMGNGEVQDPVQDLPRVTGQNDPISTPGRIVRWDTEWHWDATFINFPHQALGGHLVALGLTNANQIWEEYTYPIFKWAHEQNAIAGFAHMQFLDNEIPQTLNCCIPIEYPVEVALGSADFISEDVTDITSSSNDSCPECAIQAYYRLLNSGFRPGLAAGTDYPCNDNRDLGTLLTYVQVAGGEMTYGNWIEGIAQGRTVVSRNGHNEFVDLKVNGTATPGDELWLTGGGDVQVTTTWTAKQHLTGTLELVQNGIVVASQQASVAPGSPMTLNSTVNFTTSGWLTARRMGSSGHSIHTAAVFVTVDYAPVRTSVTDAEFYVQWMDNLLEKTSPGGVWNSFFVNSLNEAQARYQAAKDIYQQIATEAVEPPQTGHTIFTSETPTIFEKDANYELGTKFWTDVNGKITGVRLYTHASEGESHTVRIWRVTDGVLLAGPYSWNITPGIEGWKTFMLPTNLEITANTDYIVAISNSSDLYYGEQFHGFDLPIVNGNLHTYVGSGVFTDNLGTMPTSTWQNTNYFRDVVFVPQM